MKTYKRVEIFASKSAAKKAAGKNAKPIIAQCGCGETPGFTGERGIAAVCKFCY